MNIDVQYVMMGVYSAIDIDSYEAGEPIGYGKTEEEAITDLIEKWQDLTTVN